MTVQVQTNGTKSILDLKNEADDLMPLSYSLTKLPKPRAHSMAITVGKRDTSAVDRWVADRVWQKAVRGR
jgi:hypothetical protein